MVRVSPRELHCTHFSLRMQSEFIDGRYHDHWPLNVGSPESPASQSPPAEHRCMSWKWHLLLSNVEQKSLNSPGIRLTFDSNFCVIFSTNGVVREVRTPLE